MSPDEDGDAIRVLFEHEVSLINFAEYEGTGGASPLALDRAFMARYHFPTTEEFAP